MKKYFIGLMILSLLFIVSSQNVQAKGENGKVGIKKESTVKGKKHPNARTNRGDLNTQNIGSNKRLEGKEKAIQRRLEGKEKAIQRRLEGKQNAIEKRSENAGKKGHKGHGRHKRNLKNDTNIQKHTNRADITDANKNIKPRKNKI